MKINSHNVKNVMALSPMQESMLFLYLSNGNQGKYIAQICYRLTGNLKLNLILKSWTSVIEHNDALRTVFRWERLKQPIQIVLYKYMADIEMEDLRDQPIGSLETYLDEEMKSHRIKGFDITESAYRIKLYQVSDKEIYMLVSSFSIIYDGWSNSIMMKEFLETYNQLYGGNSIEFKVKKSFIDYIVWMKRQSQEVYKIFWSDYLSDFQKKNTELHTQKQMRECESHQFKMPIDMEYKVKNYIANTQVTLAAVLYAMWALWLYKSKGVNDVVFGVTVSGRPAELIGIDDVMGVFINTVPLRIKIKPSQSFQTLVREIHQFMIQMKKYENYPLAKIKACSNITGNSELFDTIVVVQNYPIDSKINELLDIDIYKSYDDTDFEFAIGVVVWERILFDIRYITGKSGKRNVQEIEKFFVMLFQKISENEAENTIGNFCGPIYAENKHILKELIGLKEIDFDEIF